MRKSGTLTHTTWECKYHVVFMPKCRKKVLYGTLRKYPGTVFKDLAQQRESEIDEGHLRPDHVHMLLTVPPKYSVSEVVGFIKGKSAIYVARNFMSHRKYYGGQNFWARGYYVSTVGRDEKTIRKYIQDQEKEDIKLEQGDLFR